MILRLDADQPVIYERIEYTKLSPDGRSMTIHERLPIKSEDGTFSVLPADFARFICLVQHPMQIQTPQGVRSINGQKWICVPGDSIEDAFDNLLPLIEQAAKEIQADVVEDLRAAAAPKIVGPDGLPRMGSPRRSR